MRNYIRQKCWRGVLAIMRFDDDLGYLALRLFAALYFIVERPYIGPDPDFSRKRREKFMEGRM